MFPLWAWLWVWWGRFKSASASAPFGSLKGRNSDKKTKIQPSSRHKSKQSQNSGPQESRVTEIPHSVRNTRKAKNQESATQPAGVPSLHTLPVLPLVRLHGLSDQCT